MFRCFRFRASGLRLRGRSFWFQSASGLGQIFHFDVPESPLPQPRAGFKLSLLGLFGEAVQATPQATGIGGSIPKPEASGTEFVGGRLSVPGSSLRVKGALGPWVQRQRGCLGVAGYQHLDVG